MEKGDISNEVVPHLVFIYEGLVGIIPDVKAQARFDKAIKRKRWTDAVNAFQMNEIVAKHIWDFVWRLHNGVELMTFLGPEFAEALRDKMDDENMPFSNVTSSTPEKLARSISYRPDIARIYDPNPSRWATYGGKGTIVNPYSPQFR